MWQTIVVAVADVSANQMKRQPLVTLGADAYLVKCLYSFVLGFSYVDTIFGYIYIVDVTFKCNVLCLVVCE